MDGCRRSDGGGRNHMRIMKVVERILFGVNCLLWGIFALDILDPGVGDCHCFDFSKDECFLGDGRLWPYGGLAGRRWDRRTWHLGSVGQMGMCRLLGDRRVCAVDVLTPDRLARTLSDEYSSGNAHAVGGILCLVVLLSCLHGGVERRTRVALARPDGRMAMARRDGGL